jgi:predicted GIY-YIG superfamily endonuclease
MATFHYAYILVSERNATRRYTGRTNNLKKRLRAHNAGQITSTAESRPWRIETSIAFRSLQKAAGFERYLKTHSGRTFASKHF